MAASVERKEFTAVVGVRKSSLHSRLTLFLPSSSPRTVNRMLQLFVSTKIPALAISV